MPVFLFIVGKFLAYWAYCGLTPRWLGITEPRPVRTGFLLAVLRLSIGFLGFFAISLLLGKLGRTGMPGPAAYALAFVPVRWIEWSALFLIIGESRSLPFNARANYWILGGVAVSCLCDAVAIVLLDAGVVHLNIC